VAESVKRNRQPILSESLNTNHPAMVKIKTIVKVNPNIFIFCFARPAHLNNKKRITQANQKIKQSVAYFIKPPVQFFRE